MNTREAVAKRILSLCNERDSSITSMAHQAGMPPSTLKNIVNGASKNPGIVTIKLLCDGLQMPLPEFFDSPEFRELEQELK